MNPKRKRGSDLLVGHIMCVLLGSLIYQSFVNKWAFQSHYTRYVSTNVYFQYNLLRMITHGSCLRSLINDKYVSILPKKLYILQKSLINESYTLVIFPRSITSDTRLPVSSIIYFIINSSIAVGSFLPTRSSFCPTFLY